ncbi:MAG: small-conductance mechanosensitive ion channel [Armatimonadota bacterium]|nr:small-conductance mechanosensitive ion channel [Armatimonadota bacterium]
MSMPDVTNVGLVGTTTAIMVWFLVGLRNVLAFLLILLLGWIVAAMLAKAIVVLLRRAHFNDFAQHSGVAELIHRMGVSTDASGLVAEAANWIVRLVFLLAACNTVGLNDVSDMIKQLLLWIPKLVAAIVVLMIGGLLANALARVVRGATADADIGNPELLASLTRLAVWGAAIVVAANQIGVGQLFVNVLYIGLVFALSLALGLSFGLGGRDTAAQILGNWYAHTTRARPRVAQATEGAGPPTVSGEAGVSPVMEGSAVEGSVVSEDINRGRGPTF